MTGQPGVAPAAAGTGEAGTAAAAGVGPAAAGAAAAGAGEAGAAAAAGVGPAAGAAPAGTAPTAAGAAAAGTAEAAGAAAVVPAAAGVPAVPLESGLSDRLAALDRLVQIGLARSGPDGFSEKLLNDAEQLLAQAGQRLRMSSAHTVVALAGGTGSGKSSLFNRLAGADFSAVGVTRPVTRDPHACVWGVAGSGPLLEWLGVQRRYRYARSSALDRGEDAMAGLILLDLPDHDSVVSGDSGQVDRLVGLADLMVWVLDPQKYADAAVHRRYLVPLAGHAEVIAVVLNQADRLSAAQAEDCITDLRRLLDSEDLNDVQVLVTSALTGGGVDDLRKLLIQTVSARRAASARLSADVDAIVNRLMPYAADPAKSAGKEEEEEEAGAARTVPEDTVNLLVEAFCGAAGVSAVGESLQSARELRALDYVGWPIGWLAERITGHDPARKVRLGKLWEELRSVTAGPSGAQQAEIDNALTAVADQVAVPLPRPWSQTVRSAARSMSKEIPGALGTAMGESLPVETETAGWWRIIGAWQGLLLGCVIVGVAWLGVIVAFGVFHAARHIPSRLFDDVSLLPWIGLMIAAILLLGWLTASGCMNLVRVAAERELQRVDAAMRSRLAMVASEMVVTPIEHELFEYDRFLEDLRVAAGHS
jgi:GTP-binding protein EngB required for normal cell division